MGTPKIRANTQQTAKTAKNYQGFNGKLRKTDNNTENTEFPGEPQKHKLLPTTTHNDISPMGIYSKPHEPIKTKKSVGIQ